jgi:cytochrome c553
MMKTGALFLFFLLIFSSVVFFSCKKDKAGGGIKTSSYNDNSSHNVGTACMNCHNSGGSNQYWWTVAGTVFKPDSTSLNPNSTVYLFSGPNGTGNLILTLPVDEKGNFYTTSSVSFGSGLYPEVKSSSGEIRYMQSSTTNGNCNSCHNSSHRIIVN